MVEIISNPANAMIAFGITVVALQSIVALVTLVTLRSAGRERYQLNKEMFGLLRKLEGLTAQRREQMLKHYDQILETLSAQLPPTIANRARETIFEAESKILTRLAELEPNLKSDKEARRKMDELLNSVEKMEQTIVALAAETVHKVMVESRRELMDETPFGDYRIAA